MKRIVICPGMHSPALTQSFIREIGEDKLKDYLIFPDAEFFAYSSYHIWQWLKTDRGIAENSPPLLFITFSAGVAGGIGAALAWHYQGGEITKFIAIDGWGVPLVADFPIYRFSHDCFTHWSSAILGTGDESFYCEPSVTHLDLWQFPQSSRGWRTIRSGDKTSCSAAKYIRRLLT